MMHEQLDDALAKPAPQRKWLLCVGPVTGGWLALAYGLMTWWLI